MKNNKLLLILLIISLICNAYFLYTKENTPIIHEDVYDSLVQENTELKGDPDGRETIRTNAKELLKAMYNNKQTEIKTKVDKMSEYLTENCMNQFKKDINYQEDSKDLIAETTVINRIDYSSLDTTVEMDTNNSEHYKSVSIFKINTTIPNTNYDTNSQMLCEFVWIKQDEKWLVDQITWNHAFTSAIQKF